MLMVMDWRAELRVSSRCSCEYVRLVALVRCELGCMSRNGVRKGMGMIRERGIHDAVTFEEHGSVRGAHRQGPLS